MVLNQHEEVSPKPKPKLPTELETVKEQCLGCFFMVTDHPWPIEISRQGLKKQHKQFYISKYYREKRTP